MMMMHPTCFLKKEDDEDGITLQRKIFDTPQIFCETAAEATLRCNPPQPRKAQYEE